jgi:hypothetical protein
MDTDIFCYFSDHTTDKLDILLSVCNPTHTAPKWRSTVLDSTSWSRLGEIGSWAATHQRDSVRVHLSLFFYVHWISCIEDDAWFSLGDRITFESWSFMGYASLHLVRLTMTIWLCEDYSMDFFLFFLFFNI